MSVETAIEYARTEHINWSETVAQLREEAGWLEALHVDIPGAQEDILDLARRIEEVGRRHGYIR